MCEGDEEEIPKKNRNEKLPQGDALFHFLEEEIYVEATRPRKKDFQLKISYEN